VRSERLGRGSEEKAVIASNRIDYPNQYTAPFHLHDRREVIIRPIRPGDEPLIVALHAEHSPHTIRMRFFGMLKTLSHDSLIHLCHLHYDRDMALAAILGEGDAARMLGVSRYYLNPETGTAEFALVVSDAYQRQGLGRRLMQRLIDIARERGVKRLVGQVLVAKKKWTAYFLLASS
jgi:acetyltransferase